MSVLNTYRLTYNINLKKNCTLNQRTVRSPISKRYDIQVFFLDYLYVHFADNLIYYMYFYIVYGITEQ